MRPEASGITTSRPLRRRFSSRHFALMHFDEGLFEQASLRNHDDISRPQRDIAFEVGAGFIGLVVEHENRLISAWHAAPDLNAPLRGIGSNAFREGDCLHQGYWLPDYVGTRP